jgi:hypothetical protein
LQESSLSVGTTPFDLLTPLEKTFQNLAIPLPLGISIKTKNNFLIFYIKCL